MTTFMVHNRYGKVTVSIKYLIDTVTQCESPTMKLLFTHFVESLPADIKENLYQAVATGLDAATELVADARNETHTSVIESGLRVTQGLSALDGAEVRVSGTDQFSTLEISVPWSEPDAGTSKLWAAARFAAVVADEVCLAA